MATIEERRASRKYVSGVNGSQELHYIVRGTTDEAAVKTAVEGIAPADVNGLLYDHAEADELSDGLWEGIAYYVPYQSKPPETGQDVFSFDTSGGTTHITQSKSTPHAYAASGTAPEFSGTIGATKDNVEGVDIVVPVFSFAITIYLSNDEVDGDYINALYNLTGQTNDDTYTITVGAVDGVGGVTLEFNECELLFKGATGSKRGLGDWEINFKFDASPSVTGLTIGTLAGIDKKGWEYLWVAYQPGPVGTGANKLLVQQPQFAYVERVYDAGDYTVLGI